MRKLVIGILILAYLSGILTWVVGSFLVPPPNPSAPLTEERFTEEVKGYPWVKNMDKNGKEQLYYKELTYLYSVDSKIGSNLLNTDWLKDSVTEEEAHVLNLLVALADEDSGITLSVSQSVWFQKRISPDEFALMEKMLHLAQKDVYLTRNITSSNWFFITGTHRVDEVITTVMDMPPDLALAVSSAPWFKSSPSLSEFKAVPELINLYDQNNNLAVTISFLYEIGDFESLQQVNALYATDSELADLFFQYNVISRDNFITLSNLSRIAQIDRTLAYSLVEPLTQEKSRIISSLASIYTTDFEMGEFASENFGDNRVALQYLEKVLEVGTYEYGILEYTAGFVTDNPEFVYEDRIEPYRYHLLTAILSELPDQAQEYRNLIFVTCAVYGNRFYLWHDSVYNTRNGWAYDEKLCDEEKNAVIELLTFIIEKNEQDALFVDVREVDYNYLYGLVDIPFTHEVHVDGTILEPFQDESGTGYVQAALYNISTLRERHEKVRKEYQNTEQIFGYTNSLTELILKEGENQDKMFLYFCAKNWVLGECVLHSVSTRMDSIVLGISTTVMYWSAPDVAHLYPAYIPSRTITEKVQAAPDMYGNPFVYKGFIAPYDEAGFRDSLDRKIDIVKVYDPQKEGNVDLFVRPEERLTREEILVIIAGCAVAVVIGARAVKAVKW